MGQTMGEMLMNGGGVGECGFVGGRGEINALSDGSVDPSADHYKLDMIMDSGATNTFYQKMNSTKSRGNPRTNYFRGED